MTEEVSQEVTVSVTTDRLESSALVLEPWGDSWTIAPGEQYSVVFKGPSPAVPEVCITDRGIEVWGWRGAAILTVLKDGKPVRGYS